ncbi:MAG: MGDG synthase family glycosyltransferase [Gaiellales bacterium]
MRVLILSAPVGAGHDAAARGVADALRARGVDVEVDDGLALMGPTVHRLVVEGYHWELEHAAWSWRLLYRGTRSARLVRFVGWALALRCRRRMLGRIHESAPDRIVSTYPLVSAVLAALRRGNRLSIPCSTMITDFDPHPAWIHPDLDANLSVNPCTPELTAVQPPVPLGACNPAHRSAVRARYGIPSDAKVALLVGGIWGVGNLHGAARAVAVAEGTHPIVVTGRNESLRRRLEADPALRDATVLGFSDAIPSLMAASDVLIQHAGGLTCLEGFAARLPVVMFDPLPGHGEDNCAEMESAGLVAVAADADGLSAMLEDAVFWGVRAQAQVECAYRLFTRECAADVLVGQVDPVEIGTLLVLRRSLRPVLGTFSVIAMVALTRAPAVAAIHHLVR